MPSFTKNARAVGGFYLDYSHGGYRYVTLGDKVYMASDVADLILSHLEPLTPQARAVIDASQTDAIGAAKPTRKLAPFL